MKLKNILQRVGRKLFGAEETDSLGWRTLLGGAESVRRANGFLEANIRAVSTAFCNGEIRLRTADGEEIPYERRGKNPLLDLLYKPAPFLTETQFKRITSAQFLVYGDVFILKTGRNTRGLPTLLIPVPKPSVEILTDRVSGQPAGYKIATTSGVYNAGLDDVIHIYEPSLANILKGRSRSALCEMDAETIQAAKTFNLAFFKNGASVGGVVSFPEGSVLTPQDRENLLAFFNDRHQGAERAHRTAILAHGGKYESYKTSHKDMEYAEGQKFSMQQIYSTMGVPPALVGLFEYAPQFNTKEQQKIFYETNVIPMARLFSDAINENLVGEFYKDESVYFEYDFSKVKALEKDWGALASAAGQLAQYWPINEVKKALDLPFSDIPGGDEPPDPVLSAFGSFAAQNPAAALLLSGQGKSAPGQTKRARYVHPTAAQLRRHKADKLDLIERLKVLMANAMKTHFSNQYGLVKAWLDSGHSDAPFDYSAVFGGQEKQVNALLALKVPVLSEVFNTGLEFEQDYIQSLLPAKDFRFTDKKAMSDRVQFWAEHYAFLWADSIEQTTFKQLDDIIKYGVAEGKPNEWINRRVLEFFSENGYEPADTVGGTGHTVYSRVQTITNTEVLATISESQLEAFRSTPYVNGKTWITARGVTDHHEGHAEMDGQTVGIDESFKNPATMGEAKAPGQFDEAGQNINCLCDMAPRVLEEDEYGN